MSGRAHARIQVGVVGLGRGLWFARGADELFGMELVALCDRWEDQLRRVAPELGATPYTDYDAFLEHDMDAVVLANYFHEHSPFAIKALAAGKHVLSETAACFTVAEAVELVRAVERSGKIYMLAENYPYFAPNQEMRRLFGAGEIGDFRYGEGEYVHPFSTEEHNSLAPRADHWRHWIPATYYCTHALAPIMFITDTRPVKASGFVIPYDTADPQLTRSPSVSDVASVIMLEMDNGAFVRLLQGGLRGGSSWYRVHGNLGLMENLRHGDDRMLRVIKEPWEKGEREPRERIYLPNFPHHHVEASRTGHGGGDFFVNYEFAQAIRRDEQPFLDVYRGAAMSIVGALAWRSALAGSAPVDVPDLRDDAVRQRYEGDDWSPVPDGRPNRPPTSVLGDIRPTTEAMTYAEDGWRAAAGSPKSGKT